MKQYFIKFYSPDGCNQTAVLTPICDDPEYCEDSLEDKCIIHKGATLTNLNAPEDTRLDVILKSIDEKLSTLIDLNKLIDLIKNNADVQRAINSVPPTA